MTSEAKKLSGRVALVTGAGRGIGKAIALAFASEGADVVVVARTPNDIEDTAHEIVNLGRQTLAIPADISDPEQVEKTARRVFLEWARIDILVNAAGMRAIFPGEELPFERWQEVIKVNLTGSMLCSQAVFPYMWGAGHGKIIMVGSMQAHAGPPQRAAFITSKTGLLGLTRALGVEWAHYGINVNLLSPGYIDTDSIQQQAQKGQINLDDIVRRTPMGRIGKIEDLTGPAIFLTSRESDFMCGQALVVDGGWMAYGLLDS